MDLRRRWHIRSRHAFAFRASGEIVSKMEDRTQLLLGPEQGLRGYAFRRFDGMKRYVVNVEGRTTLMDRRAFTAGAVRFVDVGRAWASGEKSRPAWAAGLGGRLGLSRVYGAPVLRIDLGYGFEDETCLLFVGLGQYL